MIGVRKGLRELDDGQNSARDGNGGTQRMAFKPTCLLRLGSISKTLPFSSKNQKEFPVATDALPHSRSKSKSGVVSQTVARTQRGDAWNRSRVMSGALVSLPACDILDQ